jgi:hypothetical protein
LIPVLFIIYPQYWEAHKVESTILNDLAILKEKFYHPKPKSSGILVVGRSPA